jgi:2-phospho-L-lactate guanylyltransferase
MLWALVPAKLGATVKTRLGAVLTHAERAALAHAMLSDVLAALREVAALSGVAVITRDDSVATLAGDHGAVALREERADGLNAGVAEGIAGCRARGASAVIVVMGDLPMLTAAEIARVVALLPEHGIVLVPSLDGTGTNVLALRPPGALPETHFGAGSLARHRAAAARLDLATVTCALPGAAVDIDTVDDLAHLLHGGAAGRATRRVLEALGQRGLPAGDA